MITTTEPVRLTRGIRVIAAGEDLTSYLTGEQGVSVEAAAINESGHLILTLSDGQIIDAGMARGEDGADPDLTVYATNQSVQDGDAQTLAAAQAYADGITPPAPDLSGYATTDALTAEAQARLDGDAATLAAAQAYADGITPPPPDLTGYATDEDLAGEATARSDADTALGARIDALPAPAPAYDDSAVRQLIATEATTRSDADAALDARVDALESAPGHDLTGYATDEDLAGEATARSDADTALGARIDALPAPAPAYDDSAVRGLIADEANARTAGDDALDARVDALEAVPAPDLTGYATDQELAAGLAGKADTEHDHDARYVRTVNGTEPDAAGNVAVAGGSGGGVPPIITGAFVAPLGTAAMPSASFPAGTLSLAPYEAGGGLTATALAVYVSSAAAAGTFRLAIYSDDNGRPGDLIFGSGTIAANSGGWKEHSLPNTVIVGRFWCGLFVAGAAVNFYRATRTYTASERGRVITNFGAILSMDGMRLTVSELPTTAVDAVPAASVAPAIIVKTA